MYDLFQTEIARSRRESRHSYMCTFIPYNSGPINNLILAYFIIRIVANNRQCREVN